jgi:hypothetical protein
MSETISKEGAGTRISALHAGVGGGLPSVPGVQSAFVEVAWVCGVAGWFCPVFDAGRV